MTWTGAIVTLLNDNWHFKINGCVVGCSWRRIYCFYSLGSWLVGDERWLLLGGLE